LFIGLRGVTARRRTVGLQLPHKIFPDISSGASREALNAIPERTAYFFWTGNSTPKTAAGVWQESLKRLFIFAGVPEGHAHRFRDTFSVGLLLAGVPIERVSILLGQQSARITEKHYAP